MTYRTFLILSTSSIESWTQFLLTLIALTAAVGTLLYKFLDVFKQIVATLLAAIEALHKNTASATEASAKADAAQATAATAQAEARSVNEQLTTLAAQVPTTSAPAKVDPPTSPTIGGSVRT